MPRLMSHLDSMSPLTTQGKAFMGKTSMPSSASVDTTRAADSCCCSSTVEQTKVAKGTTTGMQAHSSTHTASRYLRCARYLSSCARWRPERAYARSSRPDNFADSMHSSVPVVGLLVLVLVLVLVE